MHDVIFPGFVDAEADGFDKHIVDIIVLVLEAHDGIVDAFSFGAGNMQNQVALVGEKSIERRAADAGALADILDRSLFDTEFFEAFSSRFKNGI
jgi:hypothetical protein